MHHVPVETQKTKNFLVPEFWTCQIIVQYSQIIETAMYIWLCCMAFEPVTFVFLPNIQKVLKTLSVVKITNSKKLF